MTTATTPRLHRTLPAEFRERLLVAAQPVDLPQGVRLFNEGGRADRFWIIRSGAVQLDLRVPGRRPAVIGKLGPGDLVGWSWLLAPHVWQLGATTASAVRADMFDADMVRRMCADDRELGQAVALWVGEVVAGRLLAARTSLLDLYAPYGSGARG
ncbi:cyclic nucleotide-binding domain-containing protein [Streptomyces mangrovisoli]|uniref:Regulator n=1 Tax=Streptomyces mangrovisoli TaxID=1428628 RepID=A0A1J4P5C6_9ACTN|nr:cyclic nucleotide-binding domain-containing protein [Streptomyces mangrovisoli]OIJ68685.1 regulator [Streptomyces mangrovisoli]